MDTASKTTFYDVVEHYVGIDMQVSVLYDKPLYALIGVVRIYDTPANKEMTLLEKADKPFGQRRLFNAYFGTYMFTMPVLRKAEDLTEEELSEYNSLNDRGYPSGLKKYRPPQLDSLHPLEFTWLTGHGIDLFGLIDSGEAIHAKTLIHEN